IDLTSSAQILHAAVGFPSNTGTTLVPAVSQSNLRSSPPRVTYWAPQATVSTKSQSSAVWSRTPGTLPVAPFSGLPVRELLQAHPLPSAARTLPRTDTNTE